MAWVLARSVGCTQSPDERARLPLSKAELPPLRFFFFCAHESDAVWRAQVRIQQGPLGETRAAQSRGTLFQEHNARHEGGREREGDGEREISVIGFR